MSNNYEENRRKTNAMFRSIYDYVMGVLWLSLGIVFLFHEKIGINVDFDPVLEVIFGVAALLYGAFRLYRGYKKK
jgi:hypothetical protein